MCSFPWTGLVLQGYRTDWSQLHLVPDSPCWQRSSGYVNPDFCHLHERHALCELKGHCRLCGVWVVSKQTSSAIDEWCEGVSPLLRSRRADTDPWDRTGTEVCTGCAYRGGIGSWRCHEEGPFSRVWECRRCGVVCRPPRGVDDALFDMSEHGHRQRQSVRCRACAAHVGKQQKAEIEYKATRRFINKVKKELKHGYCKEDDQHDRAASHGAV